MAALAMLGLAAAIAAGVVVWRRGSDAPRPEPATSAQPDAAGHRKPPVFISHNPAAELRAAGMVLAPSGAGIPGAEVCLSCAGDSCEVAERRAPVCVLTASSGSYRLEGIERALYHLSASAVGHRPSVWTSAAGSDQIDLRDGDSLDGLDLVLLPGGAALRGIVSDAERNPVAGAEVAVHMSDGADAFSTTATTHVSGAFEIWVAPGEVQLIVRADGYAESVTDQLAPSDDVRVTLVATSVVRGRVVAAETGEPLGGLTVLATDDPPPHTRVWPAISDDAGTFELTGLPPGRYQPLVRSGGWHGRARRSVAVRSMEVVEDVVIEAHGVYFVTGKVVLGGGERLCEAGTVTLTSQRSEDERAPIDPDGYARFVSVVRGAYDVLVQCDGYRPHAESLLVEADTLDQVWTVEPGLAVHGVVVDGAGGPVPEVAVEIRSRDQLPKGLPGRLRTVDVKSSHDGTFRKVGLWPGTYQLMARAGFSLGEAVEVTLAEGREAPPVRLVIARPGTLRGEVVDGGGRPAVATTVAAQQGVTQLYGRTDAGGRFAFESMAPGSYVLTALQPIRRDQSTPPVDANSRTEVEVKPDTVTRVTLTVAARDGAITGKVVAVDGAPLPDVLVITQPSYEPPLLTLSHAIRLLSRPQARTDDAGTFVLKALEPGTYNLTALRDDGGVASASGVETGASVTLTMEPPGVLAGTVVLAQGGTPSSFTIGVKREGGMQRIVDTFAYGDGHWTIAGLPPGTWNVLAQAQEGKGEATVSLPAGQAVNDVRVVLVGFGTVTGQIVDLATRAPIAGVTVAAFPPAALLAQVGGPPLETTDDAGRFAIKDVPAGDCIFEIHTPNGYGPAPETPIVVRSGEITDLGAVGLSRASQGSGEP